MGEERQVSRRGRGGGGIGEVEKGGREGAIKKGDRTGGEGNDGGGRGTELSEKRSGEG